MIQARELSEEVDLKWKAANRQLQNEVRDLRFLAETKDSKIRALDRELAKMRAKMEKALSKMYMPSQDEVVEGLAGDILERGEMNLMARVGGHQQEFELSHPVGTAGVDSSALEGAPRQALSSSEEARKWAEELTKADDRSNRFRHQLEEAQKRKEEVEDKLQLVEKQLYMREEEIKRLQKLYEGGQSLEVLSVKHTHELNEKTIGKLANQVDFLNKENHTLQQQVGLLRGDKTTLRTLDSYKTEIDNLLFENGSLRKDLAESSLLLKAY